MMKELISMYAKSPRVAAVVVLWGNPNVVPPTPSDLMPNAPIPILVERVGLCFSQHRLHSSFFHFNILQLIRLFSPLVHSKHSAKDIKLERTFSTTTSHSCHTCSIYMRRRHFPLSQRFTLCFRRMEGKPTAHCR